MHQPTSYTVPVRRSISEFSAELDQAFRLLSEELQRQRQLLDGEQPA